MLWMGIILMPLIHCGGGVEFQEKYGVWPSLYDVAGVIVEAANPHLLHPTSILDVYKVF